MIIPMRYCLLCCKRYGLLLIFAVIVVFAIINLLYLDGSNIHVHSTVPTSKNDAEIMEEELSGKIPEKEIVISKIPSEAELRQKWIRDKVERLSKKVKGSNYDKILYVQPNVKPNYNVHVFYYPWYRNIQHDGEWSHWNHEYLPNWKKDDPKVYPTGRHKPPDDIGSNYYPVLGCYSSIDPEIIDSHMKQIREAGIGVVSVSWFPPSTKDTSDEYILTLLESAKKYDLHISVHLEPYEGRNAVNQRANIRYFIEKFGQHPSLHRMEINGKDLPVFFVYDSYRIQSSDWKEVFSQNGKLSLRGTEYDGVFFGLLVDMQHRYEIKKSHFDGFYTYFATNGFSYGSSWKNWQSLGKFAQDQKLLFAPSIGPGYIDTTVRPWNAGNIRLRRHGRYYEVAWRAALSSQPAIVTITSFNEWHEGTQIEPALPKKTDSLLQAIHFDVSDSVIAWNFLPHALL
ncbi:glycoprotein endo-alpha-1,2-mannosidase isoform X2 [Lycorma delicatula]|uniref:glycoprotein endo-alpha-1,2-mannosidase isoform X2 n=1 Tax=Lycorma delicatula TaxID=130591 RepID=UPI003F516E19